METQYILLITDNFLTYSSTMLIMSKQSKDLKAGLILLTSTLCYLGPILFITKYAFGFLPLSKVIDQ